MCSVTIAAGSLEVMDNPAGRPRRAIDLAVLIIVFLEVALLAFVGAGYALYAVMGRSTDVAVTVTLAAVAGVLAAVVGYCALAWWRRRDWARSVLVTWQVLQFSVGVFYAEGEPVVASALMGSALVVAVVVVAGSGNWTARTP